MSRPTLIIAARDAAPAVALSQFVSVFTPSDELPHSVQKIVYKNAAELFEFLGDLPPEQLFNAVVVLDIGAENVADIWNVERMEGKYGFAAQLVLSFPEIYFVFIGKPAQRQSFLPATAHSSGRNPTESEKKRREILANHHFVENTNLFRVLSLIRLHALGFRVLFDPTCLRSYLKYNLLNIQRNNLPDLLAGVYRLFSQNRLIFSAVITEEESSFLYLNGYAAYKFGFRTWVAHSLGEFLRFFESELTTDKSKWSSVDVAPQRDFEIGILDWHLVYRDDDDTTGQRVETVREAVLNENLVRHLVVVTSFPQNLERNYGTTGWFKKSLILQKPYGGLFELVQKKSKPDAVTGETPDNRSEIIYEKIWSRIKKEISQRRNQASGQPLRHSAPYASSSIAERLLARGNAIKTSDPTATEFWIYAALLAAEAKELLGGLSLTTTYQAIALQHEAEVRAEVSFLGMSTEIEVNRRLSDLKREIEEVQKAAVGNSDTEEAQKRMSEIGRLNCMLSITHHLRLRFTEHEQMRAAEHCLIEFVKHQHRFNYLTNATSDASAFTKFFRRIANCLSCYLDKATKAGTSVSQLFLFSLGWILLFTIFFTMLFYFHPSGKDCRSSFISGIGHATYTFIEIQPGLSEAEKWREEAIYGQSNQNTDSSTKVENQPNPAPENPSQPIEVRWVLNGTAWFIIYWILMFFELVIAYVHMGLLVSVLYRRITKRAP